MTSILLEVELHLRLPNHPCHGRAVQVPVPQDWHGPVRTTLPTIPPPHATQVHVRDLPSHARLRFDALDQDLLQLSCGTGGLFHSLSIAS